MSWTGLCEHSVLLTSANTEFAEGSQHSALALSMTVQESRGKVAEACLGFEFGIAKSLLVESVMAHVVERVVSLSCILWGA